ncbi:MAG: GNAT family N-acetyltransferase, partial [Casimicrobiaceae bacterium]|nr:GNAT family N-acetyltransferase [Casimicrobiaceae bacterium]
RRVGAEDATSIARLARTVPPSVLCGLPFDHEAQWAARLEALEEPRDFALALFDRSGRALAFAQLHSWAHNERLKHSATLTQLIAPPTRSGGEALARLLDAVLEFAHQGLMARRLEVLLDEPARWMSAPLERAGFELEATCRGRAAVAGVPSTQWRYARIAPAVLPFPAAAQMAAPQRRRRLARRFKLTLRPATEADAEGLAALYAAEGAARGSLQHPRTTAAYWRSQIARIDGQRASLQLVAEVEQGGGRLIAARGSIMVVSDDPREKHVATLGIAVRDDWQGQGLGRALMRELLDHADRWAHWSRVELTVFSDNVAAIALYESFGFEREGLIRDYALREGGYAPALQMARLRGIVPSKV